MPRFENINLDTLDGETKEFLDVLKNGIGMTPNLIKGMAASPSVLKGYYHFNEALSNSKLNNRLRLMLALLVAEINNSEYCLAASSALCKTAGLNEEELMAARNATSSDKKIDRALKFARAVIMTRGKVRDKDVENMKKAGYRDSDIIEIIAHISMNILTNFFAEVAQTPVGFPKVKPLSSAAHL